MVCFRWLVISVLGLPQLAKTENRIAKRACEAESWKPDDGKAEYSRPANNTQVLIRGVSGPASLQITAPRLQSFTASMDISFSDAVSLGVGFDLAETVEDSSVFEVFLPEGQNGDWGFTSYLLCTTGTGRCGGNEVRGEICTPKTRKEGDGSITLTGIHHLVVHS